VANISENLADNFTFRDLQLNRLSEGERRRVFTLLNDVQRSLLQHIAIEDPTEPIRQTFRQKRLTKLMSAVNEILRDGYAGIAKDQKGMLKDLAVMESVNAQKIVNRTVGIDLLGSLPTATDLRALVDDVIIEGAPVQDWWSRQAVVTREQFRDQMRQGLFLNETNSDLMRRVRGTREARFQNGIMGITRKNADRIVRTSTASVANAARESTFRANDDVIRGVQALATLDTRTSDICKARSGGAWNLKTGRPLPQSPVRTRYPGPPPWHWRCRTVLITVLKSFNDLVGAKGKRFDDALEKLGPGTQTSMDGQVAGDLTFDGWLKKQTVARQTEALGPGRLKLWQDGKISMTDLIDQRGRPLTLEQLE